MANAGDTTFEGLWKKLLVYLPTLPPAIAQEFVNTVYSRLLDGWRWSGLRKSSEFIVPAPHTLGTANVTQNSASVVGTGTSWTSSMVGRQFFTGSQVPFYDIIALNVSSQTITLDRPYADPSNATSAYSIDLIYLVCPSDFSSFLSVVDLANNWKLHTNYLQEDIDLWDPKRTTTGTPKILAYATQDANGLRRYEIYPRVGSATTYPFRYTMRPALLALAGDKPIFPIRGDVIREGALAELGLWAGTKDDPNPYFDPGLSFYKSREERFLRYKEEAEKEDQGISQNVVTYFDDLMPAPLDAAWLQTHDSPF